MNSILSLQSDYLNGNEQALDQLYLELVKLGKTIIRCESLRLETDAAYDMASSVIMRLSSLKQPIIKSAPSAFVKRALYFHAHNIQKNHNSQCVDYPTNIYTTDEYFVEEVCDDLVWEILENIQVPEELVQAVTLCLFTQQPVKAVRVRIRDREDKKRFTKIMEEINEYIHQKDVCVSMLQWNSNGGPQVLSKTPVQRSTRKRKQVVSSQQAIQPSLPFFEMVGDEDRTTNTRTIVCKVRSRSNRGTPCDTTPWLPGLVLQPGQPSQPMP